MNKKLSERMIERLGIPAEKMDAARKEVAAEMHKPGAVVAWLVESGPYSEIFTQQASANAQAFELSRRYEASSSPLVRASDYLEEKQRATAAQQRCADLYMRNQELVSEKEAAEALAATWKMECAVADEKREAAEARIVELEAKAQATFEEGWKSYSIAHDQAMANGQAAQAAEAVADRLRTLVPEDMEMACAQAVEFAEYVEQAAKGAMVERARHYLSLPYAQELSARLRNSETAEARAVQLEADMRKLRPYVTVTDKLDAKNVADRRLGLLREARDMIRSAYGELPPGNAIDGELTGTPVADGGENSND